MSYHQSIQQALLPQLTSARLAVRKRTIIALGMKQNINIIANHYKEEKEDLEKCNALFEIPCNLLLPLSSLLVAADNMILTSLS